jgi:hypothetical protein
MIVSSQVRKECNFGLSMYSGWGKPKFGNSRGARVSNLSYPGLYRKYKFGKLKLYLCMGGVYSTVPKHRHT